jgi:nitrite reductase/ring-hydroxylating ferredoxin subunit
LIPAVTLYHYLLLRKNQLKNKLVVANINDLKDRKPAYALVSSTDLVVVKYDDNISVFYGRCLHRGALMADGFVDGHNLICGCAQLGLPA